MSLLDQLQSELELSATQKQAMRQALLVWLDGARKTPVRNLDTLMVEMRANIAKLVERLRVVLLPVGVRVQPAEADLATWQALQRGTTWLEACDNLDARLLAAAG